MQRRLRLVAAPLVAGALIAAACGGSSDGGSDTGAEETGDSVADGISDDPNQQMTIVRDGNGNIVDLNHA